MSNIHVIAEAGTNHNADLPTARKLVDAALAAGVDSVKFQVIYPEGLYLPVLWQEGVATKNEVFQKRADGMLSDGDYGVLADYARERGIPFSASVFDARGLSLLDGFDPPYIKIASCDLNNVRFLAEAASLGRRLILSTGMASLSEIEQAVEAVTSTGHQDLVLLHCVSIYPSPLARMNLSFIDVLRTTFGFPVGLSDHTESSLAAAIAVSKGVTWIEKHFTLDRRSTGFDHAYAMEPAALAQYVSDIRESEQACMPHQSKLTEGEQTVKGRARRSLYAARDLAPGERLTEADVLVVRPEGPLSPAEVKYVLDRPAKKPILQYQALDLEMFG